MESHSHFGVYAVVKKKEKLLVIRKARGPYTGLYDLPGGTPEALELLEETVVREVLEETGTVFSNFSQLGAVSALYRYVDGGKNKTLRHIGVLFEGIVEGEPIDANNGEDSFGAIWVPKKELSVKNATPFVLKAIQGFTSQS